MEAKEPTVSRRWVFTHWLQGTQTVESARKRLLDFGMSKKAHYMVAQFEGEERVHIQGYVELTSNARKSGVIPLLWKSTEWDIARADSAVNTRYCTKTAECPFEWPDEKTYRTSGTEAIVIGEPRRTRQGHRSDLDDIKEMMDEGRSMAEIADTYFGTFVRNFRGLREYKILKQQKDRPLPTVEILWGGSRTGKSLYCRTMFDPEDTFFLSKPNGNRVWWDGYDGQSTVVIDEYYGWMPYDFILRLLDAGPLTVETKGGSVSMLATRFIITSNTHPFDWYHYTNMPLNGDAFFQRIADFGTVHYATKEVTLPFVLAYKQAKEEGEDALRLDDALNCMKDGIFQSGREWLSGVEHDDWTYSLGCGLTPRNNWL